MLLAASFLIHLYLRTVPAFCQSAFRSHMGDSPEPITVHTQYFHILCSIKMFRKNCGFRLLNLPGCVMILPEK